METALGIIGLAILAILLFWGGLVIWERDGRIKAAESAKTATERRLAIEDLERLYLEAREVDVRRKSFVNQYENELDVCLKTGDEADELYRLLIRVRLNKPELEAKTAYQWESAVNKANTAYNCIQFTEEALNHLGEAEAQIEANAKRKIAVLEKHNSSTPREHS